MSFNILWHVQTTLPFFVYSSTHHHHHHHRLPPLPPPLWSPLSSKHYIAPITYVYIHKQYIIHINQERWYDGPIGHTLFNLKPLLAYVCTCMCVHTWRERERETMWVLEACGRGVGLGLGLTEFNQIKTGTYSHPWSTCWRHITLHIHPYSHTHTHTYIHICIYINIYIWKRRQTQYGLSLFVSVCEIFSIMPESVDYNKGLCDDNRRYHLILSMDCCFALKMSNLWWVKEIPVYFIWNTGNWLTLYLSVCPLTCHKPPSEK